MFSPFWMPLTNGIVCVRACMCECVCVCEQDANGAAVALGDELAFSPLPPSSV